jgi:hypothetical protein
MRTFIAALFLTLAASPAFSQESEIVADRPGLADGSVTVGRGVAQLEAGVTREGDEELLTIPLLLRYGLTDRIELRLESDTFGIAEDDNDIAPVALGFKWRFRDGDVPLSIIANVQPPSGGGILRTSEFETEARLVSDIALANDFSLTPNVGVHFVEGGEATAVFAASLEHPLGPLGAFIDFESRIADGDTSMIIDGGFAWVVRPDTQLDLSAGVDVTGDQYPDWFIGVGYSRRF